MNTNKKINGVKLSKQYMLQAALFRRTAMQHMNWSKSDPRFSADMLIELYRYESTGEANRHYDAMKRDNGYAMGKWLHDIDVANIKQENKRKLRIWRFTYLMYRWYIRYSLSRGKYLYKPNFYLHTFSKG